MLAGFAIIELEIWLIHTYVHFNTEHSQANHPLHEADIFLGTKKEPKQEPIWPAGSPYLTINV